MTGTTPQVESLEFKTEVQQLLQILAHSLYTEREIFLRELISNASDALNRLQFEMLTNHEVLDPDAELAIRLDFDEDVHTVTVSDTGIGMTRDELVENLGTIAHSGALAFLKGLKEGQQPADIIGQFGVGFYSVFTVAKEVIVTTRSYRQDAQGWRWTSRGDSQFTLSPADKAGRGTEVRITLREDAGEFASAWRIEQIVKTYSDYVSFPIYLKDRVLNQQTALWRKPVHEIEEKEYTDFYRQLTLDYEDPLLHIHLVSDVPVDIHAVLFVPRKFDQAMQQLRPKRGLRLYSHKILIQEQYTELLPEYLGFIAGVVDSEDIPLNISREMVQSSPALRQIQKALTGRVLRSLKELAEENPNDYNIFWKQFGAFIKQGIAINPLDHDDLLPLLRFQSSKSADDQISLADYVERMPEKQTAIYYIIGQDRASVQGSPHLDPLQARDLEVLYFLDPLDGFLAQSIGKYQEKNLQNVDASDLELPETAQDEAEDKTPRDNVEQISKADFLALTARFKRVLGDQVTDVRESTLLTGSPCRLVSSAEGPDRDLQRFRHLFDDGFQVPPKILELNRSHPLIGNLSRLVVEQPLHPNPADMVPRIQSLLQAATEVQSSTDDTDH